MAGMARSGTARHGEVGHGLAWQARRGAAGHGLAWQGRQGTACCGGTWRGPAGLDLTTNRGRQLPFSIKQNND